MKTLMLIPFLVVGACGDDSDGDSGGSADSFVGVYEVQSFTENEEGCDVEGPARTYDDQFFKLVLGSSVFPGGTGLMYQTCSSAAECESDSINGSWYFPTKTGEQWDGEITSYAAGGSTSCSFGATDGVAILEGGILTMDAKSYRSGSLTTTSADQCKLHSDFFVEQRPNFACESWQVLRAKKL